MITALIIFSLGSPPYPSEKLSLLDDAKFAERQRADAHLRRSMCWVNVLRLERDLAVLGAEGATRADRIVQDWWRSQYPASSALPFIDSLNFVNNCYPPDNRLVRHYMARGRGYWVCGNVSYSSYRAGTAALVDDLRRWRVPPCLGRSLLAVMKQRSDSWEFGRR